MANWQLQNAKTHLSEVIEDAYTKGPQIITRHGAERAVVLSIDEYRKLSTREETPVPDAIAVLLGGPKLDDDDAFFEIMDNIRDRTDTGRDIEL